MKEFKAYHKNSETIKYKRYEFSNGSSFECTYNEQGQELTFKGSNGSSYEQTYNEQGQVETYKNSDGSSYEQTYNKQGQVETFKSSNGHYEIKGKEVSKEEFEAFVNNDIIEVNGVKYKKI